MIAKPTVPLKHLVLEAYLDVSDGCAVDRIIADRVLNARFIDKCVQLGLPDDPERLNIALLNLRKRGGLPRSRCRTTVRNQDAYSFAAEIAVRALERKYNTTLDRVLCNPSWADEFDALAAAISPGFSALEYRYAALRLRKSNRLKPELLARIVPTQVIGPLPVRSVDLSSIPATQGLYVLTNRAQVLYVGEAQNLRSRLRKHLEHSDNKHFARHLWEFGDADLFLECHVLPPDTRTRVRKAMETELIRSRGAAYNVRR